MSDPVKSFLAGGCGGMAAVIVGQPMDMIKVQLQNQSVTNPMYTGTFDCAKVRHLLIYDPESKLISENDCC